MKSGECVNENVNVDDENGWYGWMDGFVALVNLFTEGSFSIYSTNISKYKIL